MRSTIASPPSRSAAWRRSGCCAAARKRGSRSPFLGLRVANLSPALADELRIESASEGVAVVEVPDGSMAGNVGFRRGDLIVSVNGEQITSTQDLERVTKNPRRLWRITIQRGGQQISVVLSG